MEDNKHDWQSKIIKWQERIKTESYSNGETKVDFYTLEHEALVIYCRLTGESKIIKHKDKNNQ